MLAALVIAMVAQGVAPRASHRPEPSPLTAPAGAVHGFEVEVSRPACDPADPSVRSIKTDADWASLADPRWRVFCVAPGDYRALGAIRINRHGSPGRPLVLRRDDDAGQDGQHPVRLGADQRAIVRKLVFADASHWVVDGLAILNDDVDRRLENRTLTLSPRAHHIVVQRSLVEGGRVAVWIDGAQHNTLQRSVVRRTISTDDDDNCINLEGRPNQQVHGNRIVANEVYDCTDSLQLVTLPDSAGNLTFPGTIVADNDFYLTPAMYTDCTGNPDPHGNCSTAEGRFDIKGGGSNDTPAGRVLIVGNRIWGARRTDPVSHHGSSWGGGIDVCCGRQIGHLVIEGNLVFDNDRGISVSGTGTHGIVVRHNVVADTRRTGDWAGYALLSATDSRGTQWVGNLIARAHLWGQFDGVGDTVRCNLVIDAADGRSDRSAKLVDNLQLPTHGQQRSKSPTAESVVPVIPSPGSLCTTIKRLTGPERVCLAEASLLTAARGLWHCAHAWADLPR